MTILAVSPPYESFNPGSGLPVITRLGVTVTSEQEALIRAAATASNTGVRFIELNEVGVSQNTGSEPASTNYVQQVMADMRKALTKQVPNQFNMVKNRLKADTSDFTSWNPGLAIGHADVQAVVGQQFFQMPGVVDTPIPANCPVDFGSATMRVWFANFAAASAPMSFMCTNWRFMFDDDLIVFYATVGDVKLYVDGSFVGDFAFGANGTFTSLKFPTKKPRLIELRTAASFDAIYWRNLYKMWKPKPVDGPRMMVVGDSYAFPSIFADAGGSGRTNDGMWQQIGPLIGVEDILLDAIGGTGYLNPSAVGQTNNFYQRRAGHFGFNPDVLVVHGGGCNDVYGGFTNQQIIDQAVTYFKAARTALPNAKLVFVEGFKPPTLWPADANTRYVAIRTAVQAALINTGVYYVDVATTSPWLTGTGKQDVPNGSGNTDLYIGADGVHPNTKGHTYASHRLAEKMRKILRDQGALLNQLV